MGVPVIRGLHSPLNRIHQKPNYTGGSVCSAHLPPIRPLEPTGDEAPDEGGQQGEEAVADSGELVQVVT